MSDFAELKRRVQGAGLLEKQPAYYARTILITLALLAAGFVLLALVHNVLLLIPVAMFLAFVYVQIGFIGHDAGHRQIAESSRDNDLIGLGVAFLLGLSRSWWVDQHNEHHVNPNDLEKDPHTAIPVVVFSQEQALQKTGILRFLVRYQAFYFLPLFTLESVGMRLASPQFLRRGINVKYPRIEPWLIVGHPVCYFAIVFLLAGLWPAVVFVVCHQAFFGFYLGSVFAPNHKGMMLLESDSTLDFVQRQVLTSRNVRTHPLTDFLYGGLNFQIEHHLFPSMPRNRLKDAQKIVRAFCEERGISYHETSLFGSFREILSSMHEASAPLRKGVRR